MNTDSYTDRSLLKWVTLMNKISEGNSIDNFSKKKKKHYKVTEQLKISNKNWKV